MAPPVKEWVPFHASLTKGSKRAIPRAVRFVFLELCVQARGDEGRVEVLAGCPLADALVDLLGGDRSELERAAEILFEKRDPMVIVVERGGKRWLRIASWNDWRPGKQSAERTAKWRAAQKTPSADDVTSHVTDIDVTCDVRETGMVTKSNEHETDISLLFSSSLSEISDAGARPPAAAEPQPPPSHPPEPLAAPPTGDRLVAALAADPGIRAHRQIDIAGLAAQLRAIGPPLGATESHWISAVPYAGDALARNALNGPVDKPASYLLGVFRNVPTPAKLREALAKRDHQPATPSASAPLKQENFYGIPAPRSRLERGLL